MDIYLALMHAIACVGVGDMELARENVLAAMRIALPAGIITPFAENYSALLGLVEQCLDEYFPEWKQPVYEQFLRTCANWVQVHNEAAKENVTLILTLEEYRAALCVREGCNNEQIGQRLAVSRAEAARLVRSACEKLGVSKKSELRHYVM